MKYKITAIIITILISIAANAYVIQGTASVPVMDGNIVNADSSARESTAKCS